MNTDIFNREICETHEKEKETTEVEPQTTRNDAE
jgi:hypothetical protein